MLYNALHKLKISHVFSRNCITEGFLPFKLIYGLFKKINLSKKIHRNGADFTVLIKNGMGAMNFVANYENWLDNILTKLIDKQDAVFVDIGANTGQTMLKVLPRFPAVQYYAVEPNRHCVTYLKALVEANSFNNVKLFECALSDNDGKAELLTRYQDDLLATTTHSFRKFTKYAIKDEVEMTTGDKLFKQQNPTKIDIIKIDIEGGEAKAISGLLETIEKFEPYIICEINPLNTEDAGVTEFRKKSAAKILSMLHGLNYVGLNIITGKSIYTITDISTSLESCNYIFIPQSKLSNFNFNNIAA